MMKSAVFLLVLVALVNSDKGGNFLVGGDESEGKFLVGGNEGEGNFLAADDEGDSSFIAGRDDAEYFTVTRDVLYDPITEDEIELPTRFTRASLNVGLICGACRLLLHTDRLANAVSGKVRVVEIRYSRPGVVIRSIKVNPIGTTRAASINLEGGIGKNYATIRITSRPSAGFSYRIQIHGLI